jgi:hypothetical protein
MTTAENPGVIQRKEVRAFTVAVAVGLMEAVAATTRFFPNPTV